MLKYLLIFAVAYFFFRWQNKSLPASQERKDKLNDREKNNSGKPSVDEGDYIDYEEVEE